MNFACCHNSKCTWSVRSGQSFSIEDGSVGGRSAERDELVITENFIRDASVWTRRCECSERASYGVSQGELADIRPRRS
jgi:hypothetical protein